jgi:hypothetical protein
MKDTQEASPTPRWPKRAEAGAGEGGPRRQKLAWPRIEHSCTQVPQAGTAGAKTGSGACAAPRTRRAPRGSHAHAALRACACTERSSAAHAPRLTPTVSGDVGDSGAAGARLAYVSVKFTFWLTTACALSSTASSASACGARRGGGAMAAGAAAQGTGDGAGTRQSTRRAGVGTWARGAAGGCVAAPHAEMRARGRRARARSGAAAAPRVGTARKRAARRRAQRLPAPAARARAAARRRHAPGTQAVAAGTRRRQQAAEGRSVFVMPDGHLRELNERAKREEERHQRQI